jgi:hypothetical protein
MSDDTSAVESEVDSDVSASDSASVESTTDSSSVGEGSPPDTGPMDMWGAFKSLPQFQGHDDRAVAQRLYEALQQEEYATRALQQYQSIIPVASEYLSNRELFDQWKASRDQAQQAPAQAQMPQAAPKQEESWWNPPKVRESFKQYMIRDENGREIIDPNAPFEAKHELGEYQAYKANFAKKFLENPEQALGPMVEKVAVQRAEEIVNAKIGRMQEESFVTTLEKDNSDWLYDQNGNVSAEGLSAQKYIQDARALGISGAQARWDYATRMVERDLLLTNLRMMQQYQQQPGLPAQQQAAPVPPSPADATAQRNMEYLRQQAMRTASQRPAATTDARVPQKPRTFADKLADGLRNAGFA